MIARLSSWLNNSRRSLSLESDSRIICGRLTLLLLVLYGEKIWSLTIPTVMLAAGGLASTHIALARPFWLLLTLLQARIVLPNAYIVDNHKVLMMYWCLALGLNINSPGGVRRNARYLIGGCFAWAAFWKATSGDFVDGSFLHFTLLTDGRFAGAARHLAGVSSSALQSNAGAVQTVCRGFVRSATLGDSGVSEWIALSATYWTLIAEFAIATTFLFPDLLGRLGRYRHFILVHFILITYPVATVIGFGWLLTIMGYAGVEKAERPWNSIYLVVFVALQIFRISWGEAFLPDGNE